MAEYTPVDLVVTTDHTDGHHTLGAVVDGAFVALSSIPSGYVEAAVNAAKTEDADGEPHPLAVAAAKSRAKNG